MARLVERIDTSKLSDDLLSQINHNRSRISVAPLKTDPRLLAASRRLNREFMSSGKSSDLLIHKVRSELADTQMTLGKITIAFQTASTLEALVLPERTSDPNARYIGLAINQGNVAGQDAGAIICAIILASPPHIESNSANALPRQSPKAMRDGHRPNKNATIEEQAWMATLVGNHKKAAALFFKEYRRTQKPRLLYEAARAHARNGEREAALEKMKNYTRICETECSEKEQKSAAQMIAKLEAGQSIFATSREAQYSVEAKRFFILGQKLFANGEWEGAIDAFSQAYAFAPHPDLIYNMGLAHLKAGNVGDALDFFQEYQRLVPEAESSEQAQQLFEMGVALYNIGQYDAAARRFTMAYSFLPLDETLYNLALCHKALGEKKEAMRIFQELADKTKNKNSRDEYRQMIEELQK